MTPAWIRGQLGLQDPAAFKADATQRNASDPSRDRHGIIEFAKMMRRGTGRTTEMLVKAIQRVADGKHVVINAATHAQELAFTAELRRYADVLKLRQDLILDGADVFVFEDHSIADPRY